MTTYTASKTLEFEIYNLGIRDLDTNEPLGEDDFIVTVKEGESVIEYEFERYIPDTNDEGTDCTINNSWSVTWTPNGDNKIEGSCEGKTIVKAIEHFLGVSLVSSDPWYFELASKEFGIEEFGPYKTEQEAQTGIERLRQQVALILHDDIQRTYSKPYQKTNETQNN